MIPDSYFLMRSGAVIVSEFNPNREYLGMPSWLFLDLPVRELHISCHGVSVATLTLKQSLIDIYAQTLIVVNLIVVNLFVFLS